MTLLGRATGDRLNYRGFQRRAAPADRSAAFWDTTPEQSSAEFPE